MYRYLLNSRITQSTDAALMPFRIVREMHNDKLFGNQIGETINDTDKFRVSINVYNFKANELTVDLSGNILTIEAYRERHPDGNSVKSRFQRRYVLPDDLQNSRVHAYLHNSGVLTVVIPKRPFAQSRTNF
ncbi:Small heat shock protein OV25-2 [Toxocara canis]|uniref:Small heat shock protein OV25-2 n=1 Tax=Toxocara canis TaxID=6265 RepID=A0A0B2UW38_TOXCA|nr:Small heat shock protein OV25-2 [Toxocara canis]